jgi:hypothetical protein
MISVIMPTLWKPQHYKIMLPILNDHPLIGEIIIVDNDISKTDHEILKLEKVVHLPQETNIYVNPAWNLGVENARFDKICLLSDDVIFIPSCIEKVYEYLKPENGIIGFDADSTISQSTDNPYDFPLLDFGFSSNITPLEKIHFTYGVCMFMHKESYTKIPESYKIFFGDVYLFQANKQNKKTNYRIMESMLLTLMHTTSHSTGFKDIVLNDKINYSINLPELSNLEIKL